MDEEKERLKLIKGGDGVDIDDLDSEAQDSVDNLDTFASPKQAQFEYGSYRLKDAEGNDELTSQRSRMESSELYTLKSSKRVPRTEAAAHLKESGEATKGLSSYLENMDTMTELTQSKRQKPTIQNRNRAKDKACCNAPQCDVKCAIF